MKKLSEINICNYRAYYGTYSIALTQGKNVLLYGENGSGKTSLFRAINDFFNAAASPTLSFIRHEFQDLSEKGYLALVFEDAAGTKETYRYASDSSETTHIVPFIESIAKRKAFFSYTNLLRTHLPQVRAEYWQGSPRSTNPNLFEVLINDILKDVILASGNSIATDWAKIYTVLSTQKASLKAYKAIVPTKLAQFTTNVNSILQDFLSATNAILAVFEQNIKITGAALDIKQENWVYTKHYHVRRELYLALSYDNPQQHFVNAYHNHLNEARLSALGLSLYLASLIFTPSVDTNYNILFLDDIFIGLDTSNRMPLLKVLQDFEWERDRFDEMGNILLDVNGDSAKEKYKPFERYQIFMTTYDRHWFEIAKQYLNPNKWQSIEMYAHFDEALGFDVPLILPSEGYYEKAYAYFRKNKDYKDYPAAANYLRKECEQQFKRILYGKYLLKKGEKGTTELKEQLGELKIGFDALIKDLGFDAQIYANFAIVVKTVLNPLSHDNLQKPIYKKELQDAFALIDLLRALEKRIFWQKDTQIYLETENAGIVRKTVLKVIEDIWIYTQKTVQKTSPIHVQWLWYEEDGQKTDLTSEKASNLTTAYNRIYHHVFNIKKAADGKDIISEFQLLK